MKEKLYVGNLPFSVDTDQLRELFSAHGEVVDAIVLTDRDTGRSRGFGFVTMGSSEQAETACEAMNGSDCQGRSLVVNEARERRNDRGGGFRG